MNRTSLSLHPPASDETICDAEEIEDNSKT